MMGEYAIGRNARKHDESDDRQSKSKKEGMKRKSIAE